MNSPMCTEVSIATGIAGTEWSSVGKIFIVKQGIVFGDWAAHPSHNGRRGILDTTGPEDPNDGWSVTHVPTGLEAWAPLMWEEEAINYALELSKKKIAVTPGQPLTKRTLHMMQRIIVDIRNKMHPAAIAPEVADTPQ